MKLTVDKKDLLRGLARTHSVADRKSSMPILSNILIAADDNDTLRFASTDLYVSVKCSCPGEIRERGSVAISAKTLFDIVKNLPDHDVKLELDQNLSLNLSCGKIKYRIPGMAGEDFPGLPSSGEEVFADIEARLLGELVQMTQHAMSADLNRPHMAGTLFEGQGNIVRMVTTDGHRLSKAEGSTSSDGLEMSMLIPSKGISELKRLIEDVQAASDKEAADCIGMTHTAGHAFFQGADMQLSVKLCEDSFPPYAKVIPQSHQRRAVAARHSLADSIKRISLVASDKGGGLRLVLEEGRLQIQSENPDVGAGSEELDVDYPGDGLSIGFNARYLMDALNSLVDDEVALEFGGELEPLVIRPVGETQYVGVVMPMRI